MVPFKPYFQQELLSRTPLNIRRIACRNRFYPEEDVLLAQATLLCGTDWNHISAYILPTKTSAQISNRFKDAARRPQGPIMQLRSLATGSPDARAAFFDRWLKPLPPPPPVPVDLPKIPWCVACILHVSK
jgi:hypothetical protein